MKQTAFQVIGQKLSNILAETNHKLLMNYLMSSTLKDIIFILIFLHHTDTFGCNNNLFRHIRFLGLQSDRK